MRVSRELPDDLVLQLRRARQLEITAGTFVQEHHAIAATSTLMLAAADAGWLITDIATVMGLRRNTASKRINDARRRRGDVPAGLIVDQPPRIRSALAELETPVADRHWLTRSEAAELLDVAPRTIHSFWVDGLLPNTRKLTGTWRAYLRADLRRVPNGPRRGVFLDRAALRVAIEG